MIISEAIVVDGLEGTVAAWISATSEPRQDPIYICSPRVPCPSSRATPSLLTTSVISIVRDTALANSLDTDRAWGPVAP
jgi:hypothetical protein